MNQGNNFLQKEICEDLALRELKKDLQALLERSEPCNPVWTAYTIFNLRDFSNRLQKCYCATSGYVPKPIGYEQGLPRLQREIDLGSPYTCHPFVPTSNSRMSSQPLFINALELETVRINPAISQRSTLQLYGPRNDRNEESENENTQITSDGISTEGRGGVTLSGAQIPIRPMRKTAIRPVIPRNFAALHPPASSVVPKENSFKFSATSAPFIPSSRQSSSEFTGGEQSTMNPQFFPVGNNQFTSDEAEGADWLMARSENQSDRNKAWIRTLFIMFKRGYFNV
jgi:hypothetical protein